MCDPEFIRKMKIKEITQWIIYIIYFTLALTWWVIVWHLEIIDFQRPINNWFDASYNVVEIVMLSYSYRLITKNMQTYHMFRYHDI